MELYTRRTIAQCLDEGWTLMSTNFGKILKNLWAPLLLMATVSGVSAPIWLNIQRHIITDDFTLSDILLPVLTLIAMLCAVVIFEAKTFKLLNEQTTRWCIRRTARFTALMIVIMLILSFVIQMILTILNISANKGNINPAIGLALTVAVSIVLIIMLIIVVSPLLYANVKYMIEPETKIRHTWKNYKRGWKSLGKIFAFQLLSALIIILVQGIVSLSGIIVILAANFSLSGMAFGDPDGLPANFMLIYAITVAIASLIYCALMIWFTLSAYYLYASIEAKYRQ